MQESCRPAIPALSMSCHLFGHGAGPAARPARQLVECREGFAIGEGEAIKAVMGKQEIEAHKACGLARIRCPQKAD